jgi:uncharacterized protein (DUF58 family)
MGQHLNRAKAHFGTDTRGLLDGGRYALLHTRSLEFDELRPYVPGDDVRDIDWKASVRSSSVLVKRYVSEKHHQILLVADAGANMSATAPSGETKSDVAGNIFGAVGLITLGRADEIGMVFGDARGCVRMRQRRGETHIEGMLHRYDSHARDDPAASDIAAQLDYVTTHYRRRMVIVVVSDEPDPDARLAEVLARLAGRHDVMWAMIADAPAADIGGDDGYDVATGRFVDGGLSQEVVSAYRKAERLRVRRLSEFFTSHAVPHTTVHGSDEIRRHLVAMTQVFARAG